MIGDVIPSVIPRKKHQGMTFALPPDVTPVRLSSPSSPSSLLHFVWGSDRMSRTPVPVIRAHVAAPIVGTGVTGGTGMTVRPFGEKRTIRR